MLSLGYVVRMSKFMHKHRTDLTGQHDRIGRVLLSPVTARSSLPVPGARRVPATPCSGRGIDIASASRDLLVHNDNMGNFHYTYTYLTYPPLPMVTYARRPTSSVLARNQTRDMYLSLSCIGVLACFLYRDPGLKEIIQNREIHK